MTNSKQPMADRVAAHNAGEYDAELTNQQISIASMCRMSPLDAVKNMGELWEKKAAQVAILSDMLGECEQTIKLCSAALSGQEMNKNALTRALERSVESLTNAKLAREMK